jgi:hypothetical protein
MTIRTIAFAVAFLCSGAAHEMRKLTLNLDQLIQAGQYEENQ